MHPMEAQAGRLPVGVPETGGGAPAKRLWIAATTSADRLVVSPCRSGNGDLRQRATSHVRTEFRPDHFVNVGSRVRIP